LKLLVSVLDEKEALEALTGGANIIDVKNPGEGSLGASPPRVVEAIRSVLGKKTELSVAVGDVPDLPGTVSLAVLGAVMLGVDYVKIGLYGPKTLENAYRLAKEACETVKHYKPKVKVVLASYADYARVGCLPPLKVADLAYKVEADVVMVDTKIKDGKKSLEFMGLEGVKGFVKKAHNLNLLAAVAGSLTKEDLPKLVEADVDVAGFRTCVCGGDRINGRVKKELVAELVKLIKG
jgi:hypothetical protein